MTLNFAAFSPAQMRVSLEEKNSLYWESIYTSPCRARQFLDISSGRPVT